MWNQCSIKDPESEGFQAYMNSKSIEDCPYEDHRADDWIYGFKDAEWIDECGLHNFEHY